MRGLFAGFATLDVVHHVGAAPGVVLVDGHHPALAGRAAVVARFPDVPAWASRVAAVRITTVGAHAWRSDPGVADLARA